MTVRGLSRSSRTIAGLRLSAMLIVAALGLSACPGPRPDEPPYDTTGAPAGFPAERYRDPAARGASVYAIRTGESIVEIRVFRAGALARLGHDHVIASRDVQGFVLLREAGGDDGIRVEADLYAPLAALTVDEPALRDKAGFDTEVSESARDGTRANMLASLEAGRFPFIRFGLAANIESLEASATHIDLDATILLHGETRRMVVPARASIDGRVLRAAGSFALRQSDFAIEPYSALGGALSVRDEIEIDFTLAAVRIGND